MNNAKSSPFFGILAAVLVLLYILTLGWFLSMEARAEAEAGMQVSWNLVVNGLLLSIPLVLFYGSVGLLIVAYRQRKAQGQISRRLAGFIYWAPRVAGVVIILFVALFSLDVFSEGGNFWEMLGGFVMHSLPSIVMGVLMAFAWRRPVVGFIAFGLMALFFMRFVLFDPMHGLGNFILFTCPMAVIAALFWANWKWKDELSSASR